jgi:hypothetical protein
MYRFNIDIAAQLQRLSGVSIPLIATIAMKSYAANQCALFDHAIDLSIPHSGD